MVSRDPSSTPITKPHSVEQGAGLGRDLGQEQDSAWSGGRTQHREGAGLSMERGQDSRIWGPAHAPQDQRGQQVPLSYPQPHQREATAGLWPF